MRWHRWLPRSKIPWSLYLKSNGLSLLMASPHLRQTKLFNTWWQTNNHVFISPKKMFFSRFSNIIPITFLTGFYVTQVVTRYWDQFLSLPWPDRLAYKMVSYVPGKVSLMSQLAGPLWASARSIGHFNRKNHLRTLLRNPPTVSFTIKYYVIQQV